MIQSCKIFPRDKKSIKNKIVIFITTQGVRCLDVQNSLSVLCCYDGQRGFSKFHYQFAFFFCQNQLAIAKRCVVIGLNWARTLVSFYQQQSFTFGCPVLEGDNGYLSCYYVFRTHHITSHDYDGGMCLQTHVTMCLSLLRKAKSRVGANSFLIVYILSISVKANTNFIM